MKIAASIGDRIRRAKKCRVIIVPYPGSRAVPERKTSRIKQKRSLFVARHAETVFFAFDAYCFARLHERLERY